MKKSVKFSPEVQEHAERMVAEARGQHDPIVGRVGGVITTWDGGDAQGGGTVVACGDPALHARLVGRLRAAA